jgi:hypothetical protein
MKITPSIIKAHEKLSKRSLQFLEYVNQNPGSLKADNYRMLELNDDLFQLQPWPTFINPQTKNEMKEAGIKVVQLIKSIPGRIFANDYEKISRSYGISPNLVRYFLDGFSEEDLQGLLARGDFIFSRSGPKCLEYNINTNLGGLQLPLWESLYLNTPVTADFLRRNNVRITNVNLFSTLFEHLLCSALDRYPGVGEVNIAVVFPNSVDGNVMKAQEGYYNSVYINLLKKHNLAGEVIICLYSQLNVVDGYLYYNGKKVYSLLEWVQGFVPAEIVGVFKRGNILIYNGAAAGLLSTKLNLALLSELEDSEILTGEERETIKKYIPWTRKVKCGETTYGSEKIGLQSFISANRERLVLKPLVGYGGKDIHVGRYTPAAEWEKLVGLALNSEDWIDLQIGETVSEAQWYRFIQKVFSVKSWVVQEYVESPCYLYQWGEEGCAGHRAVWGYYVFGSRYAGAWVRVSPGDQGKGIINCHRGAKVSVVFEVDE